MKKLFTFILLFLVISSTFAQFGRRGRQRNMNRIPQNTQPTEAQIEARKKEMDERRAEYVANFIKTLEAGEFEKEIIKQKLDSYYTELKTFYEIKFESQAERKDALEKMTKKHFEELEPLISESDTQKIHNFTKGKFEEKKEKKKKKRRKRRKRNKN